MKRAVPLLTLAVAIAVPLTMFARPIETQFRICMQLAVNTREQSLLDSLRTTDDDIERAFDDRRLAYRNSWDRTDDKEQRDVVRDADKTYNQAVKDARQRQRDREKNAKDTFKNQEKTCNNELNQRRSSSRSAENSRSRSAMSSRSSSSRN